MSRSLFSILFSHFTSVEERMSRREMLKRSMAVSVAALVAGCTPSTRRPSREAPKIIVVGAGFAGLSAAYRLAQLGYDVTVIDARNRVGGRVLSWKDSFVAGRTVEAGGEFIGTNHANWIALTDIFSLPLTPIPEDAELLPPLVFGGRRLERAEVDALYKEMDEALARLTDDARDIPDEAPWTHRRASEWDAKTAGDWITSLGVTPLCAAALRVSFEADNGVAIDRQSYLANLTVVKGGGLEHYWTDSETHRLQGGNAGLAEALMRAIGPERIQLREPVERISYRSGAVEATSATGRKWVADDVVLAIPPSVWSGIRFEPELAIPSQPQMGRNVKQLLHVTDRSIWKGEGLSSYSLMDASSQLTWETTESQPGDDNVVLTAFAGADRAMELRAMSPAEVESTLAPAFGNLRGNIKASRLVDWVAEPWTMASYSFPSPGQVTALGPIYSSGLERLHFAGEHTSFRFIGYMEGALSSGASVAERIARRDGYSQSL